MKFHPAFVAGNVNVREDKDKDFQKKIDLNRIG